MNETIGTDRRRWTRAAALAAMLLLATVGAARPNQEPNATPPGSAQTATMSPNDSSSYRIQKGDQLHIRVFNLPELEHVVRVRPDGRISLLLLGDVDASGLEPTELAQQLNALYKDHFRDPKATVIVSEIATIQVYIGGEVQVPQMMLLDPQHQLTVTAAIFRAGGFLKTGKTNEVVLLRNSGDGTPVVSRLNVKDILNKGEPDLMLQPYDVVYVPKTRIANVNQWVDQFVRQNIPFQISFGFTYLLNGNAVVVPN